MNFFAILFSYIKTKYNYFAIFFLFTATVYLVAFLGHREITSLHYGFILSFFLLLCYSIYDYIRFFQVYKELQQISQQETILISDLSPTQDPIQREYQKIIKKLNTQFLKATWEQEKNFTEMSEYYSLWAHQIKTPLFASSLLLQKDIDSSSKDALKQEIFKVEQYVSMALQFIRSYQISSDLDIQEYDLYEIVKSSVKKFSLQFIHKKIKLEFEPFHCLIKTDGKWLSFVFEQLLSNALKYTETGSITLSLIEDSDSKAVFQIVDTGIGIRPEDLPRIFEKGYTGFNGRQNNKSTGIGLYLTKKILNHLNHPVTVQSTPQSGTTLQLTFVKNGIFFE